MYRSLSYRLCTVGYRVNGWFGYSRKSPLGFSSPLRRCRMKVTEDDSDQPLITVLSLQDSS